MWIENLRGAFRSLRSTPGFSVTAILSLAIGIGGSVSMFTVVNSILLKPLEYPDSGRLVRVANADTRNDSGTKGLLPNSLGGESKSGRWIRSRSRAPARPLTSPEPAGRNNWALSAYRPSISIL